MTAREQMRHWALKWRRLGEKAKGSRLKAEVFRVEASRALEVAICFREIAVAEYARREFMSVMGRHRARQVFDVFDPVF